MEPPHVEELNRWQRAAVDAVRQPQAGERDHALGPRRRAAGEQHRPVLLGPAHGDGAGVVARVAFVLVGGVMLLVNHDQANVV